MNHLRRRSDEKIKRFHMWSRRSFRVGYSSIPVFFPELLFSDNLPTLQNSRIYNSRRRLCEMRVGTRVIENKNPERETFAQDSIILSDLICLLINF